MKTKVTKKQAEVAYSEICALFNAGQLAHDEFLRMEYKLNLSIKHLGIEFYHKYHVTKESPLKKVCVALSVIVAVYTIGALGFWASLTSFSF
jgi:hypothetical protein